MQFLIDSKDLYPTCCITGTLPLSHSESVIVILSSFHWLSLRWLSNKKKIVVQLHWLYSDLEDSTSCPFNVIIILVPNTFLCSYKGLFTFHKALENSQGNPRRSLIYKKKFFSNLKAKIFFSFFWRKVLTFSLPIFNFFNFSLKISRLNVDWTENLFDTCHLNHWPLKLGGNT